MVNFEKRQSKHQTGRNNQLNYDEIFLTYWFYHHKGTQKYRFLFKIP